MKQYTVVYNIFVPLGSRLVCLTNMDRVETNDVGKLIEEDYPNAQYIFEGWPKLEGDDHIPKPVLTKEFSPTDAVPSE